MPTITKKPIFESNMCERCSGTGLWARNAGRQCFKCNGRGWLLTKRGERAAQYYAAKRQVPIESLKVGDAIAIGGRSGWWSIKSITTRPANECGYPQFPDLMAVQVDLERSERMGGGKALYTQFVGEMVTKAQSNADKQSLIADALAYQATLSKSGKIAKQL